MSAAHTARAQWRALGTTAVVAVTEPRRLAQARVMLTAELAAIDLACSRFRSDSETVAVERAAGRPVAISSLLTAALEVALTAAAETDGAVDPTMGAALEALGYDRDYATIAPDAPPPVTVARLAGWRSVRLDAAARTVQVPPGVRLDLGATAKAFAADRAAYRLADSLDCGVLVSLGGDIAVSGPAPHGGWAVRVQDRPGPLAAKPDGPHQTVAITQGALATSSTTSRTWRRGGSLQHHIVDPRTLRPARSQWRTVSVTAPSCVRANVASTHAIVTGAVPPLPARLVAQDGAVTVVGGWPAEALAASAS